MYVSPEIGCPLSHCGSQFRYAKYSMNDKMKKGPILGVILKQEYPPIIEGTDRDGQPILYHARNWSHYSHTVRDDGQTPADRVKAEFWVSINFLPIAFFLQLSSSSALSRLMLDGFFFFSEHILSP